MDTTHSVAVGPVYDARRVSELLHVVYNDETLAAFGPQPEPLQGFITFFDPGLNVLGLRAVLEFLGKQIFLKQPWYLKESFAKVAEEPHYRQLSMEAVKNSFGKTFVEQQTLVPPGEEIPTARVVLMAMVIHFLPTGQRLFPTCYVRCVDQVSGGGRVGVGRFDSDGFDVSRCRDGFRHVGLGLASSRKF